jgi:hypothetical protein
VEKYRNPLGQLKENLFLPLFNTNFLSKSFKITDLTTCRERHMDQNEMSNLYRGSSIDAFYQVSYHLAKRFQRKSCFRNRIIRNKNCLWQPCLLMNREEMSNVYRGPSIDAFYQVSYHLAKRFQRKSCFRNRTIRNKNWVWRPCLLTDQNGMSNSHRGLSIDASYQVSVYLAKLCQSRRFLEIDQFMIVCSLKKNVCKGR